VRDDWDHHMTAVEMLELELIVRDFVTILNVGSDHEIHAFLSDDITYRPSVHQCVIGRSAVVAMICDIRSSFAEWRTEVVSVAVTGPVVLAELALRLALPYKEPQLVMGFASFRVDDFRISAWHQIHA
jgi:limonene-1,2-epoxide hydrolase